MRPSRPDGWIVWLTGLATGLAVAYVWPHEPAYATNSDRAAQFTIVTIPVGQTVAGVNDPIDGVFTLDFLTGQLRGAVLNRQTGKFTATYNRDLAKDFGVNPQDGAPQYAVATGLAPMAGKGGLKFASGVVYVAELSSGKLAAYSFPWTEALPKKTQLTPVDVIQWREEAPKDN